VKSNCFTEAFRRWFREGGQFAFQPSMWGPFPHVPYRPPGNEWVEFAPVAKKFRHRWPPMYFDGIWRAADDAAPTHPSFGDQASRHRVFWSIWLMVLCGYFAAVVLRVGWSEIWHQ
jgi:hypothetical protein